MSGNQQLQEKFWKALLLGADPEPDYQDGIAEVSPS